MENNYIDVLDSLMQEKKEKKRKSPTQYEQQEFYSAWLKLASENGLNDLTESYLYQGFYFCGSSAFVAFLQISSNPKEELLKLLNGKRFSEDCTITFRVLINTLAIFLNQKAPSDLIVTVMKYLPKVCLNKEGAPLKTAPKSFEKYFLSTLNPLIELPQIASLPARPGVLNTFCTIISELLNEIKRNAQTYPQKISDQATNISKWIKNYTDSLSTSNTCKQESDNSDNANIKISASDITKNYQGTTTPTATAAALDYSKSKKISNPIDQINEFLVQIKSLTLTLEQENIKLGEKLNVLTETISERDKSIEILQTQLHDSNEEISDLNRKIEVIKSEGIILQQTINEKEHEIQQKNVEIAERTKMANILSRDRARQSSELIQKLASKVRVEYRDFSDAKDLPMTCDLGENMRLQLQNIFDILEKGGMKIK